MINNLKKYMDKGNNSKRPNNKKLINIKPENIKAQLRQSQERYVHTILENEITLCQGPAGTSKTFTACYTALKLLANKEISQIVLCKPIQEAGEKLGFLPGDIADKIDPFMQSYISNITKIVGHEVAQALVESEVIVFRPMAYMRGDTFDNSLMILDEAQNATFKQIMLFVTRMGKGSKVIVTGDISQYDIPKNNIGLPGFIQLVQGVKGIGMHFFTTKDIVRAKILQIVVDRYDKWKMNNPDK
ncbi:PhoH family protein [bacterium]|nr:PhoH family protein [bacterium]